MTEAYTAPLQKVIGEFKNISPDIVSAFVFKKNGDINASNEASSEDQIKKLITTFNNISNQAEFIGDVQALTIQGVDRQLRIDCINTRYIATVYSIGSDQGVVQALTHVIVPTVTDLIDQVTPQAFPTEPQQIIDLQDEPNEQEVFPLYQPIVEVSASSLLSLEPPLPDPPANQLLVEKIGGLLAPSDTVQIDSGVIAKWSDLFEGRRITQLRIETLEGRAITCKFRALKASGKAKGIIQIPEKILQALQTSKGNLVIIKPVIAG